jgi:hypothetical protein
VESLVAVINIEVDKDSLFSIVIGSIVRKDCDWSLFGNNTGVILIGYRCTLVSFLGGIGNWN